MFHDSISIIHQPDVDWYWTRTRRQLLTTTQMITLPQTRKTTNRKSQENVVIVMWSQPSPSIDVKTRTVMIRYSCCSRPTRPISVHVVNCTPPHSKLMLDTV